MMSAALHIRGQNSTTVIAAGSTAALLLLALRALFYPLVLVVGRFWVFAVFGGF